MEKTKSSYGMISASRVNSTGTPLFGSDIMHENFITVSIKEASHELGRSVEIFPNKEIIRIAMTAVQWADLLCNMNTQGVPCTIERRVDCEVERYQPIEDRLGTIFREGKTYLENAETKGLLKRVREVIENSRLSKKDKKELEVHTRLLDNNLRANASFYLKRFIEEADKVVIDSKSEIEANKTHIMKELGKIKLNEIKQLNNGI